MESREAVLGSPAAAATSEQTQKFSLFALTMMVVGSMVGAGIWSLPRPFATATGVFGAIIAWLIAAGGMYTLARMFQALAERKPDLDAGVYAYAKAGFGDYLGFLSALGYFFSACLGNTFYWVLPSRDRSLDVSRVRESKDSSEHCRCRRRRMSPPNAESMPLI